MIELCCRTSTGKELLMDPHVKVRARKEALICLNSTLFCKDSTNNQFSNNKETTRIPQKALKKRRLSFR